jgi:septum formation protein
MTLILASESAARRRMLSAVGITHRAIAPSLNETECKAALRDQGVQGADLALALAEAKAMSNMQQGFTPMILGCDQILICPDGKDMDKAPDMGALADQLRHLSGRTHRLFSAAVIVEDWGIRWSSVQSARMTMRPLSEAFIAQYLAQEGEALLGCVGGYRIEGLGAQLFTSVDGNNFVVQGLPLLPLLDYLRSRDILPS